MNNKICIIQDNKSCLRRSLDTVNIRRILSEENIIEEKDIIFANYIIIVSCGFNNVARSNGIELINKAVKIVGEKNVLVIGCIPGICPEIFSQTDISFIHPSEYEKLPAILKKLGIKLANKLPISEELSVGCTGLHQNDISLSKNTYYLNVSKGCLGKCTYCEIRKSIGTLKSRQLDVLINETKKAIINGAKTIYLGADDLGAWGIDINSNFPVLLNSLLELEEEMEIELNQKSLKLDLRNVIHPRWLVKYKYELKEIFKKYSYKLPCISLAMQSGSSEVLKKYKRYNCIDDVNYVLCELYKVNPNLYGFGHMIVGAPFENEQDIMKTIMFICNSPIQFWTCFQYSTKENDNIVPMIKSKWDLFLNELRKYKFKILESNGRVYVAKSINTDYVVIKF